MHGMATSCCLASPPRAGCLGAGGRGGPQGAGGGLVRTEGDALGHGVTGRAHPRDAVQELGGQQRGEGRDGGDAGVADETQACNVATNGGVGGGGGLDGWGGR